MRKRRVFLVLIGAAVVVSVLLAVLKPAAEPEPEYQGKKLSEWVERLKNYFRNDNEMNSAAEAEKVMVQIGTNALPYLVKWSCYEQPSWRRGFYCAVNWTMEKASSDWRIQDRKQERAENALRYLYGLEFERDGTLCQILIEASKHGRKRALLFALECLRGVDRWGSPYPCVSTDAIPSLLVCLKSADPDIRVAASNVVWKAEFLLRSRAWDSRNYATNFLRKVAPQALERVSR